MVLSLLLVLFGSLSAQERAPAEPLPRLQPGAAPQEAPDVRAVWRTLPPEERAAIERNFEQWRALAPDDRDVMRRRHERLRRGRARVLAQLDDGSGGELDAELGRMDEPRRRRELDRRALGLLRERFDELPAELRERVGEELRPLPPHQRERRRRQLMKPYVDFVLEEQLRRLVDSGAIPRDQADELGRRIAQAPGERLQLLQQFVLEHPDAFRIPRDLADKARNSRDPRMGGQLLEKLRRRHPRDPLPPFKLPPNPSDGRPQGGDRDGHPPEGLRPPAPDRDGRNFERRPPPDRPPRDTSPEGAAPPAKERRVRET